jgi:hypothetical protein
MSDPQLSSEKRYCIGCIHMYYRPYFPGYMGSEWTGRYGEEDAALLCKKGHWEKELTGKEELPIGSMMGMARNCNDYEERPNE